MSFHHVLTWPMHFIPEAKWLSFSPVNFQKLLLFFSDTLQYSSRHFFMPNYFWGVVSLPLVKKHFPDELVLSLSFKIRLFVMFLYFSLMSEFQLVHQNICSVWECPECIKKMSTPALQSSRLKISTWTGKKYSQQFNS